MRQAVERRSGLFTDLYELTMAAGYVQTEFNSPATFELFVRNLPENRSYLVAAGLEQALEFLEEMRFSEQDVAYLRKHPAFGKVKRKFFDYLLAFEFSGDVWAIPEGTIVFPNEPLLRVTAPLAEGQVVETYLLATVNFQTMVASKAARVATAAKGRDVIEFGTRRAHGMESGVLAARAAYVGGCEGTSNVAAGQRFGIPTFGTLAHSWVMAHEDEREAFARFLDVFPENALLLVDTYDVGAAVETAIALGRKPRGMRLDSGDLVEDSRWVRERLDRAGWKDVQVFASGDLDEWRIEELLRRGAKIDAFGVGTALATSADAPTLGVNYKLVEVERGGKWRSAAKFSEDKVTYPGRKQVWRFADEEGRYCGDVVAEENEKGEEVEPRPRDGKSVEALLRPVMRGGKRVEAAETVERARARCLEGVERLPEDLRGVDAKGSYPVEFSTRLEKMLQGVREQVHSKPASQKG